MLRYIHADQLHRHPKLADSMFRDRADQFAHRLKWDVTVQGAYERDEYDDLNPLYVIWETSEGRHGGSMRFLPTTGQTMVNDHFTDLTDGVKIVSPFIWETTRFCLAPGAPNTVSAALMLGGLELGLGSGLSHAIGVFDARMVRIYRRMGWGPTVLGRSGNGRDAISVGLWDFHPRYRSRLLARAGLSAEVSRYWYDRAFGRPTVSLHALSA